MLSSVLFHSPGLLPIAIVVLFAVVAAVLWLYPGQVRNVNPPWRWIIPGLRMAALLALAISIIKPVVVREKTSEERGSVLILVDRSKSMSVKDAGRTPAQLVAMASGLGRLSSGLRDAGLVDLTAEIDSLRPLLSDVTRARSELDYAKLAGRDTDQPQKHLDESHAAFTQACQALTSKAATFSSQDAELARQLSALGQPIENGSREAWTQNAQARVDTLASAVTAARSVSDTKLYETNPEVRQACDELSRLTRLAIVDEALVGEKSGLIRALDAKTPVFGFGIAGDATPIRQGRRSPERRALRLCQQLDLYDSRCT